MTLASVVKEPKDLPLALLDPPVKDARLERPEVYLEALTQNIRQNGVLQRLIVFPKEGRYGIVAGYTRFICAQRARLVFVPCEVYPTSEAALEAAKYAENRFRLELTAAEEAKYFSELLEHDCGGDVDRLCELLDEKRGYVEGRLNLFAGDALVFEALANREIQIGVAQELNKIPDELHRRYLLHQAKIGGATQAVVRGWVMDWQQQQRAAAGGPPPASTAAPIGAVPQTDFFRCCVCDGTEHVHTMVPVNVHAHCKLAILDKLLAGYHGQ